MNTTLYYDKPISGFTLAEVLITLGIIGIVASMTLPTVINRANENNGKSHIKKPIRQFSRHFCEHLKTESWSI